jgi:hypothetical protein
LAGQVAVLGRRVDYLHRRFSRDWQELPGVVLYGESHFTVEEDEWQLLRALDGKRPLRDVLQRLADPPRHARLLAGVRRLAWRGVIDLLPPTAAATNGTSHDRAAEAVPAAAR